MKYQKGDAKIYNELSEGLSFYPTTGEIYHTNRSKSKFHNFYLESISQMASARVLDIGCYTGTEIFMLPKPNSNIKYWGIDVSRTAINKARLLSRARNEKNINFEIQNANKPLKFPSKYFDVIYALELIEHIDNPSLLLKEVSRILKDEGVFIISTPNEKNFLNQLTKYLPSSLRKQISLSREKDFVRHGNSTLISSQVWDNDAHVSLWDFSKWKNIFANNGFEIEKIEGSSFFGGSRYISERPFLLGMMIILDSLIDLLPLKPYLQMCMVLKLKKTKQIHN